MKREKHVQLESGQITNGDVFICKDCLKEKSQIKHVFNTVMVAGNRMTKVLVDSTPRVGHLPGLRMASSFFWPHRVGRVS